MFIHNQSLPPIDALSSNGYFLMPGSLNYFEIDRVFYKKLAAPFSNCLKDINLFQMNKTFPRIKKKYSEPLDLIIKIWMRMRWRNLLKMN